MGLLLNHNQGMLYSASKSHDSRGARADLCLAQNSTYVMVNIFHDKGPLSYWNPVPIAMKQSDHRSDA